MRVDYFFKQPRTIELEITCKVWKACKAIIRKIPSSHISLTNSKQKTWIFLFHRYGDILCFELGPKLGNTKGQLIAYECDFSYLTYFP